MSTPFDPSKYKEITLKSGRKMRVKKKPSYGKTWTRTDVDAEGNTTTSSGGFTKYYGQQAGKGPVIKKETYNFPSTSEQYEQFSPAKPTRNAQNDQGNTAMSKTMPFAQYKKNTPNQGYGHGHKADNTPKYGVETGISAPHRYIPANQPQQSGGGTEYRGGSKYFDERTGRYTGGPNYKPPSGSKTSLPTAAMQLGNRDAKMASDRPLNLSQEVYERMGGRSNEYGFSPPAPQVNRPPAPQVNRLPFVDYTAQTPRQGGYDGPAETFQPVKGLNLPVDISRSRMQEEIAKYKAKQKAEQSAPDNPPAQYSNLSMAPGSTQQQIDQANQNWQNWMAQNLPKSAGMTDKERDEAAGAQSFGGYNPDGSRASDVVDFAEIDRRKAAGETWNPNTFSWESPSGQGGAQSYAGRYAATQEQIDKAAGRQNRGGYFPDGSPKSDVYVTDPVTGQAVPENYDRNNPGHQPGYQRPSDTGPFFNQGSPPSNQTSTQAGSRTIMPGETSEDPVAITDFGDTNVEGAPAGDSLPDIAREMMSRVPGTGDMSLQDFMQQYNNRVRDTRGPAAPAGVPETEVAPGYVTTQAMDQYLNPISPMGFAQDQANLGNMGNNLFDPRRPNPFEFSAIDPFGRTSNYSPGLQGAAEYNRQQDAFSALLGSLQQQQVDAMRDQGPGAYMPIDVQSLYDYSGTPEGYDAASEAVGQQQQDFLNMMHNYGQRYNYGGGPYFT